MHHRRLVLAVLVMTAVGCHRPIEAGPATTEGSGASGHTAAPDAGGPGPVDAADTDATGELDAQAMTPEEMRAYCARRDVYCHPSPPARPPLDAAAPIYEARVIAAESASSPTPQRRSFVTVEIGANQRVQRTWHGELFRGERRVGSFVIETVTERTTQGASDMRVEDLDRAIMVRFTPP